MCDGIGPGWYGKEVTSVGHDGIISGIWRRLNKPEIDLELTPFIRTLCRALLCR